VRPLPFIFRYDLDRLTVLTATWRYYFDASFPRPHNAAHASELQYVFGNLRDGATAQQAALSESMMKVWTDFAKDPKAGPGWERVGSAGGKDLGRFTGEGKLAIGDSKEVDGNCGLFKEYLDRRAAN
jgi:hypothetical protein